MYVTADDLRQSYVVAKNEIRKFISGKRFTLYVLLIVLVFGMITVLPYVFGGDLGDSPGKVISSYVTFIPLLIVLAATLFSSITIVSEYEGRTALILFTRPIKKTSIYLGKILACLALEAVMIVAFYIGMELVSFATTGSVTDSLMTSLGMAMLYVFATTGVAILISTVMKKGSTCAIMTFVSLLLLISVITGVMSGTGIDTWYMLDEASDSISLSIPEYVDMINEMMIQIEDQFDVDLSAAMVTTPDLVKEGAVMFAWGIVALFLGWLRFLKKEF